MNMLYFDSIIIVHRDAFGDSANLCAYDRVPPL
jgi:hypothetical protein